MIGFPDRVCYPEDCDGGAEPSVFNPFGARPTMNKMPAVEPAKQLQPDLALQLHDRATRGQTLSAEEQHLLEEWYARQDLEESATLAGMRQPQTLTELRSQVDTAVAQLQVVTQQIQALTTENDRVRQEIAA